MCRQQSGEATTLDGTTLKKCTELLTWDNLQLHIHHKVQDGEKIKIQGESRLREEIQMSGENKARGKLKAQKKQEQRIRVKIWM